MSIEANKQMAVQFLKMVVAGDIRAAYQKYVDPKGKHHNVFFPSGFSELEAAMIDNHTKFPNKQLTIKNVLGDKDLVAVHSKLVLDETEMIVVHLLRFQNAKIVEFWDCGQQIPKNQPNKDGPF